MADGVRDRLLVALVHALNEQDADSGAAYDVVASIGVILLVGGAVISGELIGAGAFYRAYGERLRRIFAGEPEIAKEVVTDFDEAAEGIRQAVREGEAVGQPRYVHLREARVISTAGAIPAADPLVEGLLLRIPVEKVDAFTLGRFTL